MYLKVGNVNETSDIRPEDAYEAMSALQDFRDIDRLLEIRLLEMQQERIAERLDSLKD